MSRHDQLVDDKSGPWGRERHKTKRLGGPLILDSRCGRCRSLIGALLDAAKKQGRPAMFESAIVTVAEAERIAGEAKADGDYGVGL